VAMRIHSRAVCAQHGFNCTCNVEAVHRDRSACILCAFSICQLGIQHATHNPSSSAYSLVAGKLLLSHH